MTVEPEPSHRPDLFNGIDQKWALPGDGSAALQLSAPTFFANFSVLELDLEFRQKTCR